MKAINLESEQLEAARANLDEKVVSNLSRPATCRVSDPHFFADPDPGKNLHADPDPVPDPGGIRGRGLGVKGK